MEASCRYLVSGRVQGVGFRWFVLREAQRLLLKGYASNLRDGRVEVVVHGESEAVEQLEIALRRGPPGARVEAVDKSVISHETDLPKTFDIR